MVKTEGKKEITQSLKLTPTTAPTAEKGLLYYNDSESKLKVCNDGATFVDAGGLEVKEVDGAPDVTNVKIVRVTNGTLTDDGSGQVTITTGGAPRTYDAVVAATGGDYTTLQAAITGGATSIFMKDGTYTAVAGITLPTNCTIVGESLSGTILNMGGFTLTVGSYNFLTNFKITNNINANHIVLGGSFITMFRMFIESTRTTNPSAQVGVITDNNVAQTRITLTDISFDIIPTSANQSNLTAIWIQNAGSDVWVIQDIATGGSASFHSKHLYCAGSECSFANFSIWNVGTAGNDSVLISGNNNQLTNFNMKGSSSRFEISGNNNQLSNYTSDNSSNLIYVTGDGNTLSNISSTGGVEITSAGIHNMVTSTRLDGSVTIGGNYNSISTASVGALAGGGANTITISGGATDNMVIGCRTDAAISDGGTGTVLTSNMVF